MSAFMRKHGKRMMLPAGTMGALYLAVLSYTTKAIGPRSFEDIALKDNNSLLHNWYLVAVSK